MNATKPADWYLVMRELTGARLALYDELLCNGWADPRTDQQQEAARWLRYHQFAWWDDADGYVRARPLAKARELWEREGPAKGAALPIVPPSIEKPEAPAPAPVHAGQMEVFALEGYLG